MTPTLEKEQTRRFETLDILRDMLRKEAKNQERLAAFESIIDTELQAGEKEGIIEFTENEWQSLITNENLPPIEEVKKLLSEKIKTRKAISETTKGALSRLSEDVQGKADKAKEAGKAKLENLREKLSPMGMLKAGWDKVWNGITLGLKIAWYGLLAGFGVKGAKEILSTLKNGEDEKKNDGTEEVAEKGTDTGEEVITEKPETGEEVKKLEELYGPMIPLKDHTETAKTYLGLKQRTLEAAYNDHKAEFVAGGAIAMKYIGIDTFVSGAVGGGKNVIDFVLHIAKSGAQIFGDHPIISTCAVLALLEGTKSVAGMSVPQDPEKLPSFIGNEVLHTPEAKQFLEEHKITIPTEKLGEIVSNITNEERLAQVYDSALGNIDTMTATAFEKIFPEQTEHLKKIDQDGLDNFIKNLEIDPKKYEKTLAEGKKLQGTLRAEKRLMEEKDLEQLMEAAESEGIIISIDDMVSYAIPDAQGNITGLPKALCSNPGETDMNVRFENAKKSNIGGQLMGFYREGIHELGDIGRKLKNVWGKSDPEIAPVVDEILQGGACALIVVGKEIILEGLYERYVLGTMETFGGVFDLLTKDNKQLVAQECISDYADGLVPIIALSYTESALNKVFQYRNSKKGKLGILRPLVRGTLYPYHLATAVYNGVRIVGKGLMERALTGNWKSVFSDPKNQFTAHFYEYVEGVRGNKLRGLIGKHGETIMRERHHLSQLYRAKALLYKFKQSRLKRVAIGMKEIADLIKDLPEFNGEEDLLKNHALMDRNIAKIDTVIAQRRAHLDGSLRTSIIDGVKKHGEKIFRPGILGSNVDDFFRDTHGMSQADALKKARERVTADTKAIDDLIDEEWKKHDELLKKKGHMPADEFARELKQASQRLKSLAGERTYHIKFGKVLDIHINPRLKYLGKFKKLGLIGIGAGALYMMFNSGYKPQEMSEELKKYLDETPDNTLETGTSGSQREKGETGIENTPGVAAEATETTNNINEEIAKTTMKIRFQRIEQSYDELQLLISQENADVDGILARSIDQHTKNIEAIKSLIGNPENKQLLTELLGKSPETKIHITPFFSLEMKDGKPHLAYLNENDFRKHFAQEIESGEFLEGLFGMKISHDGKIALAQQVGDAATYMVPIVGTFRDGYDSYEAFSRGDVGGGFISLGWGILGLASDIAIFTGVGAGLGAAGKAVRGAGAGVKGARKIKLAREAYVAAKTNFETLVSLARAGKTLDNISTAKKILIGLARHKGKAFLVAQGGQAAYMGMDSPRDSYIAFDEL